MRKKPPRRASLDEVKITREGEMAVIEHADPNVSVARVNVGSHLRTMSDAAVLDLFNAMMDAQENLAAEFDSTAVEIPPGKPQVRVRRRQRPMGASRPSAPLPYRGRREW